jgi:hypothetical protein
MGYFITLTLIIKTTVKKSEISMDPKIDWSELKATDKAELIQTLTDLAICIDNFGKIVVDLTSVPNPVELELASLMFGLQIGDLDRIKEIGKILVNEYHRLMGPNAEFWSLSVPKAHGASLTLHLSG